MAEKRQVFRYGAGMPAAARQAHARLARGGRRDEGEGEGPSCIFSHRYCKIAFHESDDGSRENGRQNAISEDLSTMAFHIPRGDAGAEAEKIELNDGPVNLRMDGVVGRERADRE